MAGSDASVLEKLNSIKARLDDLLEEAKSSQDPNAGVKEASALFKTLADFPVTFDLLRISGAGITANNIKKDWNNSELRKQAKGLIKQWRKFCGIDGDDDPKKKQKATSSQSQSPDPEPSTSTKRKRKSHREKEETSKSKVDDPVKVKKIKGNKISKPEPPVPESSNRSTDASSEAEDSPAKEPTMEDTVRSKCRDLLYNAIVGNGDLPEGSTMDPKFLAEELERYIFEDMKRDVGLKYRWRVNSRMSNLKDAKNPALRAMFLSGEIKPDQLAKMTADEMACDELKSLRAKFTQEGISKALLVTNSGSKSDLLRCGKCRGNSCSYNQFQTRGSDEPVTTFAFCNTCGNRWKF